MQGYDKPDANQEHLGQRVQRIAGFTNVKIQAHFFFFLTISLQKGDKCLSGYYRFIGDICCCIPLLLPGNGGGEQSEVCQSAGLVPCWAHSFCFWMQIRVAKNNNVVHCPILVHTITI